MTSEETHLLTEIPYCKDKTKPLCIVHFFFRFFFFSCEQVCLLVEFYVNANFDDEYLDLPKYVLYERMDEIYFQSHVTVNTVQCIIVFV